MNAGDDSTLATGDLVSAFLNCTLPKSEWTHAAHLRVGFWHVLNLGPAAALVSLRVAIRRYNEATGVANTESSGYHETITRFYVWRINRSLERTDRVCHPDDLAEQVVRECGERDLPLRYWSKTVLMSPAARLGWVPPDLIPLE